MSSSIDHENETDYEKLRLENIKRNSQFLESIGIDPVREEMKKTAARKKVSNKKSFPKIKSLPARRSSRITVISLQNIVEEAKETGNQSLLEEAEAKLKLLEVPIQDQPPEQVEEGKTSRLLIGEPLSMVNHLFQTEDDVSGGSTLLDLLGNLTPSDCEGREVTGIVEYSNLSLCEEHVTKVTKSRITTSIFHPSTSKILIAAGDKEGHLGLWTPDDKNAVYLYKPHLSNICSMFVNPMNPDQLWSVSYDSTIRYTNLEQQSFVQSYSVESDGFVTDACALHESSDLIYVSLSSGEVQMVDIRAPSCQWSSEAFDGKLNSIELNPIDKNMILTAGRAGHIALHDLRMHSKKWKPLHLLLGNSHSVNAASFSPNGSFIVSAGQDNTIQLWSNFHSSSLAISHTSRRHNNQTGRWLSTLRPIFDPKLPSTFVIGSMEQPRRVEVFTIENAEQQQDESTTTKKRKVDSIQLTLVKNLMSDNLGSVCSRNAIHQSLNLVLGGNSSGRVHLFREVK
jgi:WD repeat-containing protein 76